MPRAGRRGMNLALVNGPAEEPVAVDDMKLYLRLDSDAEDALVAAMITAARLTVEAATNLMLGAQVWRLRVTSWPTSGVLMSPVGPLRTVDAVRSVDRNGEAVPLEQENFRADSGLGVVVALGPLPVVEPGGHFEIEVALGFGAGAVPAPAPLLLAVRALVANWFDSRGETPTPRGAAMLPDAVRTLLAPFRPLRLA